MAQLGSGSGSSYGDAIDTRQVWANAPAAAPDSNTRLDAECINDIANAIINIETVLGASPNGSYGSVAARLNALLGGGGGTPGVFVFTAATTFTIPGTVHNVGQGALLFKVYDSNIPANLLDPGSYSVSVASATYDVTVQFATPTSGYIALGSTSPLYLRTFTSATTVTVLGTAHQFGTADLLYQLYDAQSPMNAFQPGSLTVHPTSFTVIASFATPMSGTLVLSAGGPRYAVNFTSVSTVAIPGNTHQLGTRALLSNVYDAATPRAAMADPPTTIDPTTFDVVMTFGTPLSGRILLMPATTLTGRDFDIRDAGTVNQSAVRMHSTSGVLQLQAGGGGSIYLMDKLGAIKAAFQADLTRLGIGTVAPTHMLELSAADAVMPGGGPWLSPSDVRQKEDVRPFVDGLETLLALAPILFRYNGKGGILRSTREFVGLVAQEVRDVAPYMVRSQRGRLEEGGPIEDLLTLDTQPLAYLLLNAVKTLAAQLLEARQHLERLEQQVMLLASRLAALEPAAEDQP